jgi:hypothetical protein
MMAMNKNLAAALSYASVGWRVHPCNGKKPRIDEWQKKATTDEGTIVKWGGYRGQ